MPQSRTDAAEKTSRPKIGAGALAAWVRAGAKEISQIIPAFPDSVKVVEEPGLPGNLTSVEVFQGKAREAEKEQETKKALSFEMGM